MKDIKLVELANVSVKYETAPELCVATPFVHFVIRQSELDRIRSNNNWKNAVKALESAHPGIDISGYSENLVREVLGDDAPDFLVKRKAVNVILKDMEELPGVDEMNALTDTDKAYICVFARKYASRVSIPGLDVSGWDKIIREYYTKGTIKDIKNRFKVLFHQLFGADGDIFKGVALKKSDFSDESIRHFFATFSQAKADKDGNFDYNIKDKDTVIVNAITTFFCTVFNGKMNAVKVDERKQENPAA